MQRDAERRQLTVGLGRARLALALAFRAGRLVALLQSRTRSDGSASTSSDDDAVLIPHLIHLVLEVTPLVVRKLGLRILELEAIVKRAVAVIVHRLGLDLVFELGLVVTGEKTLRPLFVVETLLHGHGARFAGGVGLSSTPAGDAGSL